MLHPFSRRRPFTPTRTPVARAARAACDSLEPRRLLATIVGNGTPGNDLIEFYRGGAGEFPTTAVRVTPQGGTPYIAVDDNPSNNTLVINGLGGNDTFSLNGAALLGQSVVLNGDGNGDTFNVGGLAGFGATESVTLAGGAGTDAVNLSDASATAPFNHTLTATTYDRSGTFPLLTYGAAEALSLTADADGPSNVYVQSTGAPVTVTGGSADDYFGVGNPAGGLFGATLDLIPHALTFQGAAGTDDLVVNDSATSAAYAHTVGATGYDRTGTFGSLTHAGVDDVLLLAGTGSDTLYVTGTAAANNKVYAGGGDDAVVVGRTAGVADGNLNDVNGFLRLHGDAGADSVAFNDAANTSSYAHDLRGNAYDRTEPGSQGITHDAFESMAVVTSGAADTVWVSGVNIPTTIQTNGGLDRVNVGQASNVSHEASTLANVTANLTVNGGADAAEDFLSVRDSAGPGGVHTLAAAAYDKAGAFPLLTHDAFEHLDLLASDAGADAVYVAATRAGTFTSVSTGRGAGNDAVVVGTAPGVADGNLDAIDGELYLSDQSTHPSLSSGFDTLRIDDEANPAGHTHTLSIDQFPYGSSYDRSGGFPQLTHIGFNDAALYASDVGDDSFDVYSLAQPTRVYGNGGNDALRMVAGLTSAGVAGPLTFDGGAGAGDRFTVSDEANLHAHTHTLTATTHVRSGNPTVTTFVGTEATALHGSTVSATADTFVLNGTPDHLVAILGNGGADTLIVNATSPAGVGFAGGAGLDAIAMTNNASPGVAYLAGADDFAGIAVGGNKRLALLGAFGPRYAVTTGVLDTAGGRVELNRHGFVVDPAPADVSAALGSIRADVLPARSGGTWLGQAGITVADPNDGVAQPADTSVGYALRAAPGTFLGAPHDASSILLRATLDGDANLDGAVDFVDLAAVQANYGVSQPRWDRGDFTYDGWVNFPDLSALTKNYNATLPAPPQAAAAASPFSDARIADDVLG